MILLEYKDLPPHRREAWKKALVAYNDARNNPSLDKLIHLAECYYEAFYDEVALDTAPYPKYVLTTLVTISWEAWRVKPESFIEGTTLGLSGDTIHGVPPPFLNRRLIRPWEELTAFIRGANPDELSEEAKALGQLFVIYHMIEGFLRPTWIMATFYIRLLVGEELSIHDCLFNRWNRLVTHSEAYKRLDKAVVFLKDRTDYSILEMGIRELLCSTSGSKLHDDDLDVDFISLRNEIAHHDFTLKEETVVLGGVDYANKGQKGRQDYLPPNYMWMNLDNWTKLVAMLAAWEDTLQLLLELPTPFKVN